jgi:hypothetical protein
LTYHISGIPLPIEQKTAGQDAFNNEEWEGENDIENK